MVPRGLEATGNLANLALKPFAIFLPMTGYERYWKLLEPRFRWSFSAKS